MDHSITSTMVEEKLRMLPAECLEDLSDYIDFLLYRRAAAAQRTEEQAATESYFGKLPFLPDGMTIQRELRDEWD